jgi:predicted enzyme related to lactoylglutathione lyase
MISGGVATVFVSDMDRAVKFYTEVLGLKLEYRFGNHWASIKAPSGMTIGLHPASDQNPAGRKGSVTIGFSLEEPIDAVVETLKERGVKFLGPVFQDDTSRIAYFADADGNEFYFIELSGKWSQYGPQSSAA